MRGAMDTGAVPKGGPAAGRLQGSAPAPPESRTALLISDYPACRATLQALAARDGKSVARLEDGGTVYGLYLAIMAADVAAVVAASQLDGLDLIECDLYAVSTDSAGQCSTLRRVALAEEDGLAATYYMRPAQPGATSQTLGCGIHTCWGIDMYIRSQAFLAAIPQGGSGMVLLPMCPNLAHRRCSAHSEECARGACSIRRV